MSINGSLADLQGLPIRRRPREAAQFRIRRVVAFEALTFKITRYTFECGHVLETDQDIGAKGRCNRCVGE